MPRRCAAWRKVVKSSSVPYCGMDLPIVGDVVAVVAQRGGKKGSSHRQVTPSASM
jgi:hypothetical protein